MNYTGWLFVLMSICLMADGLKSKSCLEVKKEHEIFCENSENYIDCVRTRMKRHSYDCQYEDTCDTCDCEFCYYSECGGQCNDCCNSCCSSYVQCHTQHCCHKQCHAECRSYTCRSNCRKSCYGTLQKESKPLQGTPYNLELRKDNLTHTNSQTSNATNANAHNITTIINLKNMINSTNHIDVPINLNYTNKNNITLREEAGGGSYNTLGDCCIVIGPRQCVPISVPPFTKCFYTRARQCGSICMVDVSEDAQQDCGLDSNGQPINCQQQQPNFIPPLPPPPPQPRCTYMNRWPYFNCEVPPTTSCDGCYGQYFGMPNKCPPQCYNNNFAMGSPPFYQSGYPYMAPFYPSPQQYGPMAGYGAMGYGMGGFGGYIGEIPRFDGQTPLPGVPFLPSGVPPTASSTTTITSDTPEKRSLKIADSKPIEKPYDKTKHQNETPNKEVQIDVEIIKPNSKNNLFKRYQNIPSKPIKGKKESNSIDG